MRRTDMDKIIKEIDANLRQDKPWCQAPDPKPDLMWHTPTCDSYDWKHKDVKFEVSDGIAYVILNRPSENNSMNDTLGAGINDALYALHARPDIRVAVFTGEGRMFCAGGDPKSWQAEARQARGEIFEGDGTVGNHIPLKPQTDEVMEHLYHLGQRAVAAGAFPSGVPDIGRLCAALQWHTWTTLPQFTIALVNGSAMGGGVGCVCCCDMPIACKKAFFTLSEVRIGVIPATISPYVVAKIGTVNAKRLFCTAENLSAVRAKEIGMVTEVVENMKEGHIRIKEILAQVSLCGPRAVETTKRLCVGVANRPINEPLMFYTAAMASKAAATDEAKMGKEAAKANKPMPWEAAPIVPLY